MKVVLYTHNPNPFLFYILVVTEFTVLYAFMWINTFDIFR